MNFTELGLKKPILATLAKAGYETPTPIQLQAIPPVLDGRDVVGLAQTGTGKTAAFALPIIHRLTMGDLSGGFRPVRALILSPTRELASQIEASFRTYGGSMGLRTAVVVGGVSVKKQIHTLKVGVDVLVATPGRLEDLLAQKALQLNAIEIVVLDEADQMLDIGFMPAIKRILGMCPKSRQTLLFSATMPKEIKVLSNDYLKKPVEVSVAPAAATADRIDQTVMHMRHEDKVSAIAKLVRTHPGKRIIVFTRTKRGADKVSRKLNSEGLGSDAIHGNKSQGQRERALAAFKAGTAPVLIATDIAARGIDVPGIELVVNYDLPNVPESYVHRIGRTARAGASGFAVSFCAADELKQLRDIEKLIRINIPALAVDGAQIPDRAAQASPRNPDRAKPQGQQRRRFTPKSGGGGNRRRVSA
ncbi:MAG: DEAD/DEAH box helicase [Rhodobacterales bacterium]|nr:DEAD/DEAH box helicase [Pseudomonadota bacterium]MDA1285652.1 DEAD/DEAH box helicase [Pseudomonadota bacterium]